MLIHWIWLATRPNMNDREKLAVLEHFGDPEDVFYADQEALKAMEELTENAAAAVLDKDLHPAGAVLRECMDKGIRICTYHDGAYPGRLKNIADPPLVLYYKGHLPDLDGGPVIAVVGTRDCSPYGINAATRISRQIVRCGGIIVSGLAAGIDAAAMRGALSADGSAVGVLGCGVDVVYPVCNRSLFADTERYGCLMSEFPPGTPPYKWNFPKRNRIMSGLSNGVLVVEAPYKSGALITARQAADQGRDVFVVPGNIDVDTCRGSNDLLRQGAIAVSRGWDVISEYAALYPDKICRDDAAVRPAGFTGNVMEEGGAEEKALPKVAQKAKIPEKNRASDKKKEKKPIDNGEKPPYDFIRDTLAGLPEDERAVAALLEKGEQPVDDVIAQCDLPAGGVLSALTMLEIKGIVERRPGKRVALKKY